MKEHGTQEHTAQDAAAPRRFGRSELRALGRFLGDQRKNSGLTLKRLAERSGISVASIRALEAGRSSPSLTTVLGVVEALGVPIDRAIAAAHVSERRVVVTRAGEVRPGTQRLSKGLADPALEAQRVVLESGTLQPVPARIGHAPSLCMVTQGTVFVAHPDTERIRLETGDSYHAQAGQVQAWANAGETTAQLICIAHNLPRGGKDAD